MADMNEFEEYEISESDIDKVLDYLRLNNPQATPEDAIVYLKQYAKLIHQAGHILDDKALRELYEKFSSGDL